MQCKHTSTPTSVHPLFSKHTCRKTIHKALLNICLRYASSIVADSVNVEQMMQCRRSDSHHQTDYIYY